MIEDPWFYAAAIPAVVLNGISKGGFAGGIGGVAVPLMALVISPAQAAGIMLPILIVMDLVSVWVYRRDWDRALIRRLMPAGLAGVVLGWLTFRYLNDNGIRIMLGAIAVGFVLSSVLRHAPVARRPSALQGRFWSTVSGFTSFVAHAGGPPLAVYLLPLRLDKTVFVATATLFFTVINAAKVGPYLALGLFDARNLATSVALFPVAVLGMLAGIWLRKRINPSWFFRLIYGFLFMTGLKLLWDGSRGLAHF